MKFPVSWIAEYTELPADEAAVAEAYTASGSEVEGWDEAGGEKVFDFGITVNRPDCMNIYGLAREASVLFGRPLKTPDTACRESGTGVDALTSVQVDAPDLCPRYMARVITGVRVGESPGWLKRRLEQCGLRPINVVVDVTNYVLLELGHPLHAFDMDRLAERRIVVRRAAPGEKITTLDGVERVLGGEQLVIADARRPIALAGVMGGEDTGVTFGTRDVLLEGAVFDPVNIRRTSKRTNLHTDASHRFERGVDPEGPAASLDRAAKLILDLAGGELAAGAVDARTDRPCNGAVILRHARLVSLIGLDIPAERCEEILSALGFGMEANGEGSWLVRPPSFRVDVSREADLIEEVVRVHGLEGLTGVLPDRIDPVGGRPGEQVFEERLRDAFTAAGCSEVIHMSMTEPELESAFGVEKPMELANPLTPAASVMRTSLLGPLAAAVARNRAHGIRRLSLFEIGRVYLPSMEGPAREGRRLGVVTYADDPPERWGDPPASGFLHLKGRVEAGLRRVGLQPEFVPESRTPFADGLALSVRVAGRTVGRLGSLAPTCLEAAGLKSGSANAAEIELDGLDALSLEPSFSPVSRYPSVVRDFSFLVETSVTWGRVVDCLKGLDFPDLADVHLVGCYAGKGIPEGKQSVTFSLVFQSMERTLSDEDIAPVPGRVADALQDVFGAALR